MVKGKRRAWGGIQSQLCKQETYIQVSMNTALLPASTHEKQAPFNCASLKSGAAFKNRDLFFCFFFFNPTQKMRSHIQHYWCQTLPHSHHRPGRGIRFNVVSLLTKTRLLAGSQLDTETLWNDSRPLAWAHLSFRDPL